jgi:hypothetical protein
MTLSQFLREPHRPVGEVLLDAVHAADAITRELTVDIDGGARDADTITRFIEALNRSAKLAKVAIDAGVMTAIVQQRQRDLELEGRIASDALTSVVDVLLAHLACAPADRERWRAWAYTSMMARLGMKVEVAPLPPDAYAVEAQAIESATPGQPG